jgi:hypothetical protein
LFTGAVATLYHSEDMIDFISNYLDSPNDKLLSVLADIKCSDVKGENLGRASLPMEWLCFAKSFNDFGLTSLLVNCQQFDFFSDGTCREGKKILDLGVQTYWYTISRIQNSG